MASGKRHHLAKGVQALSENTASDVAPQIQLYRALGGKLSNEIKAITKGGRRSLFKFGQAKTKSDANTLVTLASNPISSSRVSNWWLPFKSA